MLYHSFVFQVINQWRGTTGPLDVEIFVKPGTETEQSLNKHLLINNMAIGYDDDEDMAELNMNED